MTREEAIKKLESLKISLPAAKDEISDIIKLIESPWISVEDDLPCNHEELMEPICQLDNRLIYETKRVFVHCSNNSLGTAHMINFYNRWKWYPEDIDVEHWFPIPELPKE